MSHADFHERYEANGVKPPSERSTGLVFAAVALLLAAYWRTAPMVALVACAAAVVLALLAWLAPVWLKPITLAWFRFGLVLHKIVNPLIMGVLFLVVIVPAGLIMQRFYDPLTRRRRQANPKSYWVPREQKPGSMRHQF